MDTIKKFIGFDDIITCINDTELPEPPYNIFIYKPEKPMYECEYSIQVSLPNVKKEEIFVELSKNKLTIRTEINWGYISDTAIHIGIPVRSSKLVFAITDDILITDPEFKDGILSIKLKQLKQKNTTIKTLEIK